jgi:hypothetical protein
MAEGSFLRWGSRMGFVLGGIGVCAIFGAVLFGYRAFARAPSVRSQECAACGETLPKKLATCPLCGAKLH